MSSTPRDTLTLALRGLGVRHWLRAAGAGLALGLLIGVHDLLHPWQGGFAQTFARLPGHLLHTTLVYVVVALLILLGQELLRTVEQERTLRLRDHLLFVIGVGAGGVFLGEGLAHAATLSFGRGTEAGWAARYYGRVSYSLPMLLVLPGFWTLARAWSRRAADAAKLLGGAQLRLVDVQRRVLAAQLRGAQAMVEPSFLFGTLAAIEQRFESDPPRAANLIDALIRYLRAAMPAHVDAATTLAQQGELVRAWLDIEGLRSLDAMRAQVDVPAALAGRPFAPLLLVPLVAQVVQLGLGPERQGLVEVRATGTAGRIVVSVDATADGRAAAPAAGEAEPIADLRRRLAALYGSGARLVVEQQAAHAAARIEIQDPEVA